MKFIADYPSFCMRPIFPVKERKQEKCLCVQSLSMSFVEFDSQPTHSK